MKKIILTLSILISFLKLNAQGCSDAGICSISHQFETSEKIFKNNLEISTIYGTGEDDITYFSPFVNYTRRFNDRLSLSGKVTFSTANGTFGTRGQFGDAFLIGNYTFKEVNKTQWSTLLGFKFPFSSSNLKINGFSIPEDYQPSLGTFDLFIGGNFKYKKWDFNTAVQIPVINNNKNSYFKEYSGTNVFPSTNLFERKSDVLLRGTYTLKTTNNKFTFKPNVLFIYHLGEDSFENIFGKREKISGSSGLTINGNIITTYSVNKQNSFELSLATPFLVREIRPDGLTRKFVVGLQYDYSF